MIEKKTPVLSIILYVLSVLLLAYAVWSFIYSHSYISDLVASGQFVVKGHLYEAFSFYMSNCAMYFLFAIVLTSIGWIMQSGVYVKHGLLFADDLDEFDDDKEEDEENSFNEWVNGSDKSSNGETNAADKLK